MEGPPLGTDLSASQVPRILGVNIATFCLAVIAIFARFTARRLTHAPLWWDDWLMLPAIVSETIGFHVSFTKKTCLDGCWSYVFCVNNLQ